METKIKVKSKEFFKYLDAQNVMYCVETLFPDKLDSNNTQIRTNWEAGILFLAGYANKFLGLGFTTLEPNKFLAKSTRMIKSKKYQRFCKKWWKLKSSDPMDWSTTNFLTIYYEFIKRIWKEHKEHILFGLDEQYARKAHRRFAAIESKYIKWE